MAHQHQPPFGSIAQPALDRRGVRAGLQDVRRLEPVVCSKAIGHQLGRFSGAGKRARDDAVELELQRHRPPCDLAHPLDALLGQRPRIVGHARSARVDCDPVPQEIELVHDRASQQTWIRT